MINLLARCIETALIIAEFPPDERHLRAMKSQAGQDFPTNGHAFCDMLSGMMFIDLKELMASGRQCGVVVVAAGIIQGFTAPETVVASVVMIFTGAAMTLVNSLNLRRKKE